MKERGFAAEVGCVLPHKGGTQAPLPQPVFSGETCAREAGERNSPASATELMDERSSPPPPQP